MLLCFSFSKFVVFFADLDEHLSGVREKLRKMLTSEFRIPEMHEKVATFVKIDWLGMYGPYSTRFECWYWNNFGSSSRRKVSHDLAFRAALRMRSSWVVCTVSL